MKKEKYPGRRYTCNHCSLIYDTISEIFNEQCPECGGAEWTPTKITRLGIKMKYGPKLPVNSKIGALT